jgi:hypothetical protein
MGGARRQRVPFVKGIAGEKMILQTLHGRFLFSGIVGAIGQWIVEFKYQTFG